MLTSDLRTLKSQLEIDPDNTAEDKNLNFFITYASNWIEEFLNRPGLTKKERTEYYAGTNTQKLVLKSRPVFTTPTPQVWVSPGGYYGQPSDAFPSGDQLTYGEGFALAVDQEDGTSRSAILVRINTTWPRPIIRQRGLLSPFFGEAFGNIKVTYTAGYTVDTLPEVFRLATNMLVGRLRQVIPLGLELNSESYEDRSISIVTSEKSKLMALVAPLLLRYRNWSF